VTHDANIRETK